MRAATATASAADRSTHRHHGGVDTSSGKIAPNYLHFVPDPQGHVMRMSRAEKIRASAKLFAARRYFDRHFGPHAVAPLAGDYVLNVTHFPQRESNYCGPGTGSMILSFKRFVQSPSGLPLGQYNLARSEYMRTDLHGSTDFSSHDMRHGLNSWRGDAYYVDLPNPSHADFYDALAVDINASRPFAVATHEAAGGSHYNGHPNQGIDHWIITQGYRDDYVTTAFDDPAADSAALQWGPGVHANYSYGTDPFNDTWIPSYFGITW